MVCGVFQRRPARCRCGLCSRPAARCWRVHLSCLEACLIGVRTQTVRRMQPFSSMLNQLYAQQQTAGGHLDCFLGGPSTAAREGALAREVSALDYCPPSHSCCRRRY